MKTVKPAAQKLPLIDHNPDDSDWDIDTDPRFYLQDTQKIIDYWTNGKLVFYRDTPVKRANPETFVYYNSLFAKDDNRCYIAGRELKRADPSRFEVLNECYATDRRTVWTTGDSFEPADADNFEVCDAGVFLMDYGNDNCREFDDGIKRTVRSIIPAGYAKDGRQVYYKNLHSEVEILPEADPATFISMNDGNFAKDGNHVFYEKNILPKADPATWQKLQHFYSKDDKSVYHAYWLVPEADCGSFEVVLLTSPEGWELPYGKDKNRYYRYGEAITEIEVREKVNPVSI